MLSDIDEDQSVGDNGDSDDSDGDYVRYENTCHCISCY